MSISEGEILKKWIEDNDRKVAPIAKKLGVSRQWMYKMYEMDELSTDVKDKIKQHYDDLYKLLTQNSSQKAQNQPINSSPIQKTDSGHVQDDVSTRNLRVTGEELRLRKALGNPEENDDERGLIYVPIAAQAGYSRNFMDQIYLDQLDRLFIPGLPYKSDNYRYFDVEGDSMYPTLEEGMQVVGEHVAQEHWKHIHNYYIYVIVMMNRILIKRLYKKNEQAFVMISDNEEMYPQEALSVEEIRELWLVKRRLDWKMAPPKQFKIEI